MPEYKEEIAKIIANHEEEHHFNKLSVYFGSKILEIIPGRVSTEVDPAYANDTDTTIHEAQNIIELYKHAGVDPKRILIKIPATWAGIKACESLQKKGINCNMTLIFGITQAIACAEAGAKLISPFVGRILDWHKTKYQKDYKSYEDPGVLSVKEIYAYYKSYCFQTEIMGASFRNTGEILELAGCDLLTISPELLEQLQSSYETVETKLHPGLMPQREKKSPLTSSSFIKELKEDEMAYELLYNGIQKFREDTESLLTIIKQ